MVHTFDAALDELEARGSKSSRSQAGETDQQLRASVVPFRGPRFNSHHPYGSSKSSVNSSSRGADALSGLRGHCVQAMHRQSTDKKKMF